MSGAASGFTVEVPGDPVLPLRRDILHPGSDLVRSSYRWARVAVVFAAVAGLIAGCVDEGSLVGPPGSAHLNLAPQFVSTTATTSAPIARVRLQARTSDGTSLGELDVEVDPNAPSWELLLPVEIGDEPVQAAVTVEMLSQAGVVEWSGRVQIELAVDAIPEVLPVEVFRGPLDNLDIEAVTIGTADTALVEGDSIAVQAAIDGGGTGTVLFWTSLDTLRARVDVDGVVTALLPGNGIAIVAVAGPRADTLFLDVLQRVADVAIAPDTVHFGAIGQTLDILGRVVDPRGDSIAGRAVTWTVADTTIVRHIGGDQFEALSLGITRAVATSVDSAQLSDTVVVVVQQVAATVQITPAVDTVAVGGSTTFGAVARDALGNAIPGAAITWASSSNAVATITTAGVATGVAGGSVSISATSGAATGNATLVVEVGGGGSTSCSQPIVSSHSGVIRSNQTWTRAGSPHGFTSSITVDSGAVLTIEPGAAVCGGPGAYLFVTGGARLDARGTVADPILFSVADTTAPWTGIYLDGDPADSSWITHATVEHAQYSNGAVYAAYAHPLVAEDVNVRHVTYSGLVAYAPHSVLRRVHVEDARTAGYPAVALSGDAFDASDITVTGVAGRGIDLYGTGGTLLRANISNTGGEGLLLGGYQLNVSEVRVENAATVGIAGTSRHLAAGSNVLPVRGAAAGVRLNIADFTLLFPDSASQDSLLTNAVDSIGIAGGVVYQGVATVRPDLPWHLQSWTQFDSTSVLRVLPGASIASEQYSHLLFTMQAHMQAVGRADAPIRLTTRIPATPWYGLHFSGTPSDTSRLVHVLIENGGYGGYGAVYTSGAHPVRIENSRIRQSVHYAAYLGSSGSAFIASTVDTTATAGYPAVDLGNNTRFIGSTVRGAADIGVRLSGNNIQIQGGRIEGSANVGLYAGSSYSVAPGSQSPRVVGGATFPARISIQPFTVLFPDSASQDSLLGNAIDSIAITGGGVTSGTATVRPDLPWRLESWMSLDSTSVLRLLPGSGIGAEQYSQIVLSNGAHMQSVGRADAPITITARDPALWWYGLYFTGAPADTSRLVYTTVGNGGYGGYGSVHTTGSHPVRIENSRIRNSLHYGAYLGSAGSALVASAVDTTSTAGYAAVEMGSNTRFVQSTVRGAAGVGVALSGTNVLLQGGRIEGAGAAGIHAGSANAVAPGSQAPRVVGGASYPARLGIQPLTVLFPDSASQDSLLGNAIDTIAISGGTSYAGSAVVRPDLPWRLESWTAFDSSAVLRVLPGAGIGAEQYSQVTFNGNATMQAVGRADAPIVLTTNDPTLYWYGLHFAGVPADTSRLVHVQLGNAGIGGYGAVHATGSHPVRIESSRIRNSVYYAAYLSTAGSSLLSTVVDTTATPGYPAVDAPADVRIDGVTIRGSASTGLRYAGTPTTPLRVNIFASAGAAAEMSAAAVWRLGEVEDDTILGNAPDRIVVTGGTARGGVHHLRATLPWQLAGTVYVDSGAVLMVDPGAAVYAQHGSLEFTNGARIEALGSAAQPILFTSIDGTNRWSGLRFYQAPLDTSVLRHVRVEYVQDGNTGAIYTDASHVMLIDSSAIVRSTYRALTLNASGTLVRETVVDTTQQPAYLAAYFNNDVVLDGLTIRAAAGQGFDHDGTPSAPLRVNVLDGGGLAGEGTPTAVARIAQVDDDTITGNGANRIRISGGTLTGLDLVARPAWQLGLTGTVTVSTGARVIALPGAALLADNGTLDFNNGGYMEALGSAAQPIVFGTIDDSNRWGGLRFYGAAADTSVLRHVRVQHAQDGNTGAIYGDASHVVVLDSSAIVRSTYRGLSLSASGSLVRETVVDTTLEASYVAAYFNNDVVLDGLTIRAAAGQGFDHDGSPSAPMRLTVVGAGGLAGEATPVATARIAEIDDEDVSGNGANRIRVSGGALTGMDLMMRPSWDLGLAGTVTIGAGARLVGGPGSALLADHGTIDFNNGGYGQVIGSAADPVVFGSIDGTNRWGGFRFYGVGAGTSVLRHVRVEHVQDGNTGAIYGDASHVVVIDSSAIVRSTYRGLSLSASGSLVRETVVDTTLEGGYIATYFNNDVVLDGLTVRASAGQGFDHDGAPGTALRVNVYDAGGIAGEVTPAGAARLTQVEDDTLTANARNWIRISGGTIAGQTIYMRESLPLGLNGTVTLDAGARLIGEPGGAMYSESGFLDFNLGAYATLIGSASRPILFTSSDGTNRWTGIRFDEAGADTTRMRHVRVEYAQDGSLGAISGSATHSMILDTVVVERSTYVGIRAGANSTLRHVTVDTTLTANYRGIELIGQATLSEVRVRASAGDGIQTNVGNVFVSSCELIDNGRHGFNNNNGTPPTTISVTFCNLINNGANGVNNTSTAGAVNATNNWWGAADPSTAGGGDGVGGSVTTSPVANGPYSHSFPQ